MTKRQRVPRTRCSGTLTEAAFFGRIRSVLRNGFRYWKPISETRAACRVGKGRYKCQHCGKVVGAKEFEVDHVVPCGTMRSFEDVGPWLERLLVERDGLWGLCKACHQEKTNREREERRKG